ncbi:hypothetical protein GA0115259_109092 [Streptomyces sp. MnatMP-M17]|nr:hypothetical protein GA0115259_109092 [Streptomyces sp. MnatMP-M17]
MPKNTLAISLVMTVTAVVFGVLICIPTFATSAPKTTDKLAEGQHSSTYIASGLR